MRTHFIVTDKETNQEHTFNSDLTGTLLRIFTFAVKVSAKLNGWEVVVTKKGSDSQ